MLFHYAKNVVLRISSTFFLYQTCIINIIIIIIIIIIIYLFLVDIIVKYW